MISDSVTVGLIQFSLRPGMLRENLEATAKLLTSAASRGCELVILPEMWPVGYGNFDVFEKSEPVPGLYPDFMAENAKRLRICIVAGVPERGAEREVFNAAVLVSDEGEIIARHRKLHLYTPLGEQKTWTAGERFTVADTKFGRVGLLICYDGDFPESWRANAILGAEVIIQINAYESPCEDWWDKFYPATALQNAIWGILCNAVGDTFLGKRSVHFFGGSCIIAPDGEIEARAPRLSAGERAESFLLVKRLELRKRFEEARAKFSNFLRDRRPELYGSLANDLQQRRPYQLAKH